MDGISVVKAAFGGAHNWYQGTVADVSAEDANALPAGVAHPIGSLMAHILHSEDAMVSMAAGKPPLWQSGGWSERVGGAMLLQQDVDTSRAYTCNPAALAPYAEAVFANSDAILGGLSSDDLDRELDLVSAGFPQNMKMGDFLIQIVLVNTSAHTGEISALKGTMSKKGYPF